MNIHVMQPCAFCPGVKRVIEKTIKIIDDYKSSNIYLIGEVVHNKELSKQLTKHKNVKILNNKKHDRLQLVKSIKTQNNVLIFSAHGTDWRAIDYAETKKWKVYDLTCPYVQHVLAKIESSILKGFHVAYFGDKNHVEAIAAKAKGGNNLTIYKNKEDLHEVLNRSYVQILSQTTMNEKEYFATQKWFTLPAIIKFSNTICHSSRQRQDNIKEAKKYDLIFVISDPNSHNGTELFRSLKNIKKNTYFIDPIKIKINKKILKNKNNCAIYTSSSVSQEQVDRFLKHLRTLI